MDRQRVERAPDLDTPGDVVADRAEFFLDVAEPVDVRGLAALADGFDLVLVAWEDESAVTLGSVLRDVSVRDGASVSSARRGSRGEGAFRVLLIVGPEGGLSEPEVALFKDAGAVSVSVGRRVLKADWAAAAIAAMISYELGGLLP